METRFTDENFDQKNLIKPELSGINQFLLENSKKQLEKIYDFYSNQAQLLLVNGFMGTGKTKIVNHSLKFLSENTITLEYNCFETTILDDILLSFFEDFKKLTQNGTIQQPKIKSENFTQKITTYFNSIQNPIVIVLNSFESVLKNNKQEILDFIFHISNMENIKTVIIARTFDYEDFTDKINFEKVTILALEKSIFEKFLRSEGIKMIGPVSDELYKYTRGYFLYVSLSTKIINAHKLSLIKFIDGYTKSFLSFNDFILREALAFVDPVSGHLFRLLTILRHPISIKLLETINLYNKEQINSFFDKLLLSQEKDTIYLKDYYKEISMNSIPENVSVKLHKACVDLYSTQLPLKPFERDLLISRQTMRTEIEYHTMFIPKRPQIKPLSETEVEALEYTADSANYDIPQTDNIPTPLIEPPKTKEEQIKNISFIFDSDEDENKIMAGIANSINKFIDYSNKILTPEETKLPLLEIVNQASKEEQNFNYKKAIAFYQMALTMKDDDNFPSLISNIYPKIAKCYEQISDWYNALKYYDMAGEYFTNAGDKEKTKQIQLQTANIYYITYKHDRAEELYNNVIATSDTNELKIRAHLGLANIHNNDVKLAYTNYKKAFSLIEPSTNKQVLAELYFKFGAICDEIDETETAIKLYKRCTDISKNNEYLSSALQNLGMIFDDTGSKDLAIKYYKESLKIDEETKNLNGIYLSASKLAQLHRRKEPETATEYFKQSIKIANSLGDNYYIMLSNIEYGDFCIIRKDYKSALKSYRIAQEKASDKNKEKISKRINDLKIRLGETEYEKLEKEIING